ncbi:PhzF family phenazine biosynthesis protein [Herpetosiphon geysericola]|uniref:Isomerase n=1 Tax=Herpetosiphon geysericola TaxID=70996 RepID=A0A0P6Y4T8_9CHLR|nr:PhzF family phenazine biosynthesis protein [Herpetosiphon geysericola]KPL80184.1 isomerase [Herpetosiphon geysericola]
MHVPIFQVDAFTTRRFAGNPAAVVLFDEFPADAVLHAIASENNLAETAFIVPTGEQYAIRWFTPVTEVALCGHATLASAAVVIERLEPSRSQVTFSSKSGPLMVSKNDDGYVLNFPIRPWQRVALPPGLAEALGVMPVEVLSDVVNYTAILEHAQLVRELKPNLAAIAQFDRSGVVVTAAGDQGYDFVSRYFAPAKGIPEDPVTGAAHCALTPYWAERLDKTSFRAYQASQRGGEINCRLVGDRVELAGSCVFYLEGTIEI